ncbi:DUF3040 domain-containing protein [Tsukamurella paurometabola]|uniref:DUF3040 domain-containing protein n=1 Tax=Tsukamurella paurometabola TaxID=2061 RepID=A0ABS5NFQ0_TSUPA|nr:DUF3040 domain-containing protein [Tsukamurella paurometabola]MBS4103086.1 DUF3040 domain-containing protein [Tsukamurella paurometabola]
MTTTLAELLGDVTPLPTTKSLEDQEDGMEHQAPHGRWISVLVVLSVLAGLAAVVAGIALGGPWRWVSGAAVAVGIAAIIVPGVVDGKGDKGTEGGDR